MAKYTLTDIIRGIRKHGLVSRLSEEAYTFLVGLISVADDLDFKNPFTLTATQAMSSGGGNSRQAVNRRRKTLSEYKIDGKPILIFSPGNHSKNNAASYFIDYDLLCCLNGAGGMIDGHESQKCDSRDTVEIQQRYSRDTIQEEERNQIPLSADIDSKEKDEELEWFIGKLKRASISWSMVTKQLNDVQRDVIIEILQFPRERIEEVTRKAGVMGIRPESILTFILNGLVKFDKLYRNGQESRPPEQSFEEMMFQREIGNLRNMARLMETPGFFTDRPLPVALHVLETHLKAVKDNIQHIDFTTPAKIEQDIAKCRQMMIEEVDDDPIF